MPLGPSPAAYSAKSFSESLRRMPPVISAGRANQVCSSGGFQCRSSSCAPSLGDSTEYQIRWTPRVIAAPIHIRHGSRFTARVYGSSFRACPRTLSACRIARRSACTTRLRCAGSWVNARSMIRSPDDCADRHFTGIEAFSRHRQRKVDRLLWCDHLLDPRSMRCPATGPGRIGGVRPLRIPSGSWICCGALARERVNFFCSRSRRRALRPNPNAGR